MDSRNASLIDVEQFVTKVEIGFRPLKVGDQYKDAAQSFIRQWLTDPQYADYVPQLTHLIDTGAWDYLLDSFYQVIPFGTGGRRGEVGIGPNRINPWTIRASAQGHAQFLIKRHTDATQRGVVLAFDVRQFFSNKYFNDALPNPVRNLNCKDLAIAALEVYAANGIHVHLFDDVRTTPELSFAIRNLHAVAGAMFSASHNPPEHNGKKVYDEHGGQLIPPDDEALVDEVTKNVTAINSISYAEADTAGNISVIGSAVDEAYLEACTSVSLSSARDLAVVYSPLHGCGVTSVMKALTKLGFHVTMDPATSNPSGKFEHVTFNIPNPEVEESFDTTLAFAKSSGADIVISSDPDADRIGIMVRHHDTWRYLNGNEIGAILTAYVIEKKSAQFVPNQAVVIKTEVTSNLMSVICKTRGVRMIGDLLVGFKYIGNEMNKLEQEGHIGDFLFACEESHGYVSGNYIREKDSVVPAIWLCELGAELKMKGKTIVDYLSTIYSTYGYFRNYLTEIRLPGAEGMSQIQAIQESLRTKNPSSFGRFKVSSFKDWQTHLPFVSETDKVSKDILIYTFEPTDGTTSMRVVVRPSGTEPKIKFYFEIGTAPFDDASYEKVRASLETLVHEFERAFLDHCYTVLGVAFPERGYLLFWQLPLTSKMKYFEVEDAIAMLRDTKDDADRAARFNALVEFLGSNPIEKVDAAFSAKYHKSIRDYIGLV